MRFLRSLIVLLLLAASISGCVAFNQTPHIYYAREYREKERAAFPESTLRIVARTEDGLQQGCYIPPRAGPGADQPPERLWVAFNGSGGIAYDWLMFIANCPDNQAGFLLMDYPSYGGSEGKPSPRSIARASDGLYSALADRWSTSPAELADRTRVIGLSLGSATGLEFATRHPVREVVLVAPFTTLREVAVLRAGWVVSWCLIHNYDNRARIRDLAAQNPPPRLVVLNGGKDTAIPPEMGRELATIAPQITTFVHVPEANHVNLIGSLALHVYREMDTPTVSATAAQ